MHVRVNAVELPHCPEQETMQGCLGRTDIDRSILQADQIAQITLPFKELGTSCRHIAVEGSSLRCQLHAGFASGK